MAIKIAKIKYNNKKVMKIINELGKNETKTADIKKGCLKAPFGDTLAANTESDKKKPEVFDTQNETESLVCQYKKKSFCIA